MAFRSTARTTMTVFGCAAATMMLAPAPAMAAELCSRTLELKSPRMTGTDVTRAQVLLKRRGENIGKVDNVYGTGTAAAVRSLQDSKRLKVDGKLGPKTCKKLKFG